MKEENIRKAVEEFLSPDRTKSLREIAKEYGAPPSTVYVRANGTKPRAEAYKDHQSLSKYQEKALEGYLIFFSQQKTPLSRAEVRKLAGLFKCNWDDSKDIPKTLSNSWFLGFLKRCKYINLNEEQHLDMPTAQEKAEDSISQFFKLYTDYVDTCTILPDDIWNLDEAVFTTGDSTTNSQYVVPNSTPSTVSHDTSELVTVLEMISRTGKIGIPFFIYKGDHQMKSWFPGTIVTKNDYKTSSSEFMNEFVFHEWVSEYLPEFDDKWTLLLMNGHLSPTSDRLIATLISKKIIPLHFPSQMNGILQPLDRPCFDHAAVLDSKEISLNICDRLSPTQARFFETYMGIRKEAYSSKTIIRGWRRCGLLENNPEVALEKYKRQMDHDIATPDDLVEEESVVESEVGEVSTPPPPKKRIKRNRGLESTGDLSLIETHNILMEANRKLRIEARKARRSWAGAEILKDHVKARLEKTRKELTVLMMNSRKKSRVPIPSDKVVQAARMANSRSHSPVQQTDPDPTMGSK